MTRLDDAHTDPIIDTLDAIRQCTGYGHKRVFTDWVRLVFTSLARDDDAYRKHVAGYEADYPDAVQAIIADYAEAFGDLILATEATNADVLGRVYERIGGPSDRFGQFFTPDNIARAMARMALSDADDPRAASRNDPLRVGDPSCGSGRFLVAAAHELTASAPDKPAIFVGQDIDPLCARMTGINLALHGIPGYAVHGDSLAGEATAAWRIDHSQPENGVIHDVDPDRVAFGPNADINDPTDSERSRRRRNKSVDTSSNSTTDPSPRIQIDLTDFDS